LRGREKRLDILLKGFPTPSRGEGAPEGRGRGKLLFSFTLPLEGGGCARRARERVVFQFYVDLFQNSLNILQHLMVPKADDSISFFFNKCGSPLVFIGLDGVLPPIQFDNQPVLTATKISYETRQWKLSFEFDALETMGPKPGPKKTFSIGLPRPEDTGNVFQITTFHTPHPRLFKILTAPSPHPSPLEGEGKAPRHTFKRIPLSHTSITS
jgi:hypothetical protein